MNYSLRMKRLLVGSAAGAMVLATVPTGIAAADVDDVCEGAEDNGFDDVADTAAHKDRIDCLAAYEITSGVTEDTYEPGEAVKRGQMATFIARFIAQAENGNLAFPTDADDAFDDDDGTTHEDAINYLASIDVVSGTTSDTFSPGNEVTRGQMARFIGQALEHLGVDLPEDPEDAFDDDDGTAHEEFINQLAELQVVLGRNDGTYRPGDPVNRAQMATYITGAAGAADEAGEWNGVMNPSTPVETDGTVTGLPSTGGRSANQYQYVSGDESTTVTIGTNDVFFVDGQSATMGAFLGALTVGDRVSVEANSPAQGRQTHRLVNVDTNTINSGLIGTVDTGTVSFTIVEPVTGATLRTIDYSGAFTLFRVDGQASTVAAFELDVNGGDTVEVEGTGANAANIRTITLTNRTVSGTVDSVPGANEFTIRTSSGAVVGPFTAVNTDTVTVDGDNASGANFADFTDNLSVGDGITYARRLDQQTIALTNRAATLVTGFVADPTGTPVTSFDIVNADGEELAADVTTAPAAPTIDVPTIYIVDGRVATQAEFQAAVTAQDRVIYQAPDEGTDTAKRLELTNRVVPTVTGGLEYEELDSVTVTGTAAAGATVTVTIGDGNIATPDITRTVTATTPSTGAGTWTVTVDASNLNPTDADGTLQILASTQDEFGTLTAVGTVVDDD